jgi:hypothetical protein
MEITYKTSINKQFKTNEDYKIRVDSTENLIQWTIYAHAPKDMHFKAADQYGLGGEHYLEKQSFEDFYTNPKMEIDRIKKELIYLLIKEFRNIQEIGTKIKALATSNEIDITKKDYTSIVLYTITMDDFSLKISCTNKKDIEKLDLLSQLL